MKSLLITLFFLLSIFSFSQECLNVNITSLEHRKGQVIFLLFYKGQAFGVQEKPFLELTTEVFSDHTASFIITDIPKGEYAFLIYHDEDRDHIFDTNWIGMPLEGVGKSGKQNARPSYDNSKFIFKGEKMQFEVKMKYIF